MVNIPDITAFFGVAQQIFIVPAEFKCLVQDGFCIVSIACQGNHGVKIEAGFGKRLRRRCTAAGQGQRQGEAQQESDRCK